MSLRSISTEFVVVEAIIGGVGRSLYEGLGILEEAKAVYRDCWLTSDDVCDDYRDKIGLN